MAKRQNPVNEATGFARALERAAANHARHTSDLTLRARCAHLYALAATLRDAPALELAPEHLLHPVQAALNALPPQHAADGIDEPFWMWMQVAALAEQDDDYALADVMVGEVLRRVAEEEAGVQRTERMAVCWTRRGRLSRQRGALDDAEECYREALRLVHRTDSVDAWAQAQLGLSMMFFGRGNIPEGVRCLQRLVSRRPAVAQLYRLSAHHALADASRRRGQYMDALLHGWRAYDLLDRDDIRRFEVMNVLSEVALEAGELEAAERGYLQVIATGGPERVMCPAAIGLLRTWSCRVRDARSGSDRMRARQSLTNAIVKALEVLERAIQPSERTNLQLALADGSMALGEWNEASARLDQVLAISRQHGFNEKEFVAEGLQARLARERARVSFAASQQESAHIEATSSGRAKSGRTHPALKRLIELGSH